MVTYHLTVSPECDSHYDCHKLKEADYRGSNYRVVHQHIPNLSKKRLIQYPERILIWRNWTISGGNSFTAFFWGERLWTEKTGVLQFLREERRTTCVLNFLAQIHRKIIKIFGTESFHFFCQIINEFHWKELLTNEGYSVTEFSFKLKNFWTSIWVKKRIPSSYLSHRYSLHAARHPTAWTPFSAVRKFQNETL